LREGEEQETALLAKAVKVTTVGNWIPPVERGQTDELHKCLAKFFVENYDNKRSPNDPAGEPN
jgi:hypothetical protein|tara:strand:- start:52 stop:240 length:189 start_codon:yes stop_codon:yes gene_type:complete